MGISMFHPNDFVHVTLVYALILEKKVEIIEEFESMRVKVGLL